MDPPVHGVVIHECPVALQVELAESENSKGDEGDGENQTQQRVRSAATLCNTDNRLQKENRQLQMALYITCRHVQCMIEYMDNLRYNHI